MFQYSHPIADVYLKEIQTATEGQKTKDEEPVPVLESVQAMDTTADAPNPADKISQRTGDVSPQEDTPDVPIRFSEKKRLDWAGKTCK